MDAHGARELSGGKYAWLWHNDVSTTRWTTLEPQSPFYLFVPQDELTADEYQQGWALRELMPENTVGVVTARDALTIHHSRADVLNTVHEFTAMQAEEARERFELGKDARDWKVELAQKDLLSSPISESKIVPILYRPFDPRFTYYTGQSRGFIGQPQQRIMRHMTAGSNLGLGTTRSTEIGRGWEHVFCTSQMIQHHTVSLKEVNYLFPLYLYPTERMSLYDEPPTDAPGGRRANLSERFVADFAARLKMRFVADGRGDRRETFGPEDVFAYMYAVFHAPSYRSRYAEFLKIDFARLPLTSDPELFRELAGAGDTLVRQHLLEGVAAGADFLTAGSNEVEQVRYTAPGGGGHAEGRVWINREQFFAGIAPEVWAFHVGGYQVCQKWLKDRKGRRLTYEEVTHYQRVVAALSETVRLMSEIDAAIDERGGWPLK